MLCCWLLRCYGTLRLFISGCEGTKPLIGTFDLNQLRLKYWIFP
jgi:hypothetical protein